MLQHICVDEQPAMQDCALQEHTLWIFPLLGGCITNMLLLALENSASLPVLDHLVQIPLNLPNTLLAEFACFPDMYMYSHQHSVLEARYGLSYVRRCSLMWCSSEMPCTCYISHCSSSLPGRSSWVTAHILVCCAAVLTWIHAGMGAMHTHKNDGGREILGNDYDDLLMRYLEVKPFANFTYGPLEKCSLTSLECASLCHFYFLENQANNQLERYNFHFWDFHAFSYNRWSINAILFKGSDLNNELMDPNISDEVLISWTLPQKLDRHCGAVGSALVVHLAYGMQRDAGIGETGIVQHYEHLAAKLTGRLLPR